MLVPQNLILMFKRAFDLAVALITLPFLAPILAVIALAVRLSSPGPVFYRGVRAGLGGRPFRIFKFRSMVVDAERLGGGTTALDDPRVTRFGRILRRSKFDELPQIFNVILGDMSLVGPRPELLRYTEQYSGDELRILDVRPGITDASSLEFIALDRVVGPDDADRVFEEQVLRRKNALRVRYVRTRSFAGDLELLLRTAEKMFGKLVR